MTRLKKLETAKQVHSQLRRLQEADECGYVVCISCKKYLHWTRATIGHYIKRRYAILLFDECNTNPQCEKCNSLEESEKDDKVKIAHGKGLIEKYGGQITNLLGQAKQKYKTWHEPELDYLIKKWRAEIRKLKKEKL